MVCALNQALKTMKIAGVSSDIQVEMLKHAMDSLQGISLELSPAEISMRAIDAVSRGLANPDPFGEMKREHTKTALMLYPHFKQMIENDQHPVEAAMKLAASANLIDVGTKKEIELMKEMDLEVGRELKKNDIHLFEEKRRHARSLLWIADNAGESVFDKLVLEQLTGLELWIGVKGGAVLNDVTLEDAVSSGLNELGRLVTTGSNCLGVLPGKSSREFLSLLDNADLVVAKGHANFETLDTYGREIFFLLKAKCEVVAQELGVEVGDTVFTVKET